MSLIQNIVKFRYWRVYIARRYSLKREIQNFGGKIHKEKYNLPDSDDGILQ
jgi:hypothetical protein